MYHSIYLCWWAVTLHFLRGHCQAATCRAPFVDEVVAVTVQCVQATGETINKSLEVTFISRRAEQPGKLGRCMNGHRARLQRRFGHGWHFLQSPVVSSQSNLRKSLVPPLMWFSFMNSSSTYQVQKVREVLYNLYTTKYRNNCLQNNA